MAVGDLSVIMECASLAPSVHNTQPWMLVPVDGGIEVLADPARQLDFLDPTGRQLHISCGAAIEFAYLAARAAGRRTTVRLRPDPARTDLLAGIDLDGDQPPTDLELSVADAIPRRYTDRGPYTDEPVSPQLLIDAQTRCAELGVWVRILDKPSERTVVSVILEDAEAAEAADPRYAEELRRWTSDQPREEGLPMQAAAPSWPADRVSDMPLRDFSGHGSHRRPDAENPPRVERDTLVLLGTPLDDDVSWLLAGRALGWVLLRAAADGASAQPLGPAIDLPDSRAALRRELGLVGHPQFLLRVGYGSGQPGTRRHSSDTGNPESGPQSGPAGA